MIHLRIASGAAAPSVGLAIYLRIASGAAITAAALVGCSSPPPVAHPHAAAA